MKQGKKHMGGRRRYVKQMLNIPGNRVGIKSKTPNKSKPKVVVTPTTSFGTVKKTLPKQVGKKVVVKNIFGGKSKPSKLKPGKTVFTNIATQPTREMFKLK